MAFVRGLSYVSQEMSHMDDLSFQFSTQVSSS